MIGDPRRLRLCLASLAAINMTAAVSLIVLQPSRSGDLRTVYDWCRQWLFGAVDVYTPPHISTDYPPNAISLFSPLALISERWLVVVWTAISLALAPLLPYVVARAALPKSHRAIGLICVAFLCWASARTLLQFSVLSMALAFAALSLADDRPVAAGFCLGIALAKPHIALPVALWACLTGRIRVIITSAFVVLAACLAYCWHADAAPWTTAAGWWRVLSDTYGGAGGLVGVTSIRRWTASDTVWIVAAGALLLIPAAMAVMSRRASGIERLAVVATGCLWSLLAFYHNGNNLILMLPAFVVFATVARAWVVVALQIVLMADVQSRTAPFAASGSALGIVALDVNRVVVLLALGGITLLWWQRRHARIEQRPEGVS